MIQIGARYFTIIRKRDFRLNFPELSTSLMIIVGFVTYATKIQVRKAAIGMSTLLLRKSKKSRIENPMICIPLNGPKPREDGKAINTAMKNKIMQAGILLIWNLSIRTATNVSSKEIDDVSAANSTRIKKTAPMALLKAILLKTFGSITNIREGPFANIEESPLENTKTAGTIIKPARKATPVSKHSTCVTDFSKSDFFGI